MYYAECGKTLCMTFPQKKAFKKYKNKTLSPAGKTVREPPVCLKIHHVIPCPAPHPEPAVCWLLERKSESRMKNHKGSPKQHRWQREKLSSTLQHIIQK